jgi:hypothetical protein
MISEAVIAGRSDGYLDRTVDQAGIEEIAVRGALGE